MLKLHIAFLLILLSTQLKAALPMPPHIGPVGLKINDDIIRQVEENLAARIEAKEIKNKSSEEDRQLQFLLAVGKRASLWLNVVNAHRSFDNQLDLSHAGSSGGVPISDPMKTSTAILVKQYNDFLTVTPKSVSEVLTSTMEFPVNPPVSDQEFVVALRKLDRIYQNTIRHSSSLEWLSWYINRAIFDVRGYLFLNKIPDLKSKLAEWTTLSSDEQNQIRGWLLGLCRNGDFDLKDCHSELRKHIGRNSLFGFYQRFAKYGKSMYDLFYTIKKTRPEIHWNKTGTILFSPFQLPERDDVKTWLKKNVEDEWQGQWQDLTVNLLIDYKTPSDKDIPRIQFKEGTTANVNGIAGNLITMEAEYPINSSDQEWTIRHEYGHVLGFEDCYLEFYDTEEKAMIYYEIDVDNLMCSRNGSLKPTHIEQLKKAYK